MEAKMTRPRVAAIVPAAGFGKRLGLRTKKPFVRLGGKPLVVHALQSLNRSSGIDRIVVASEPSCLKRLRRIVTEFRLDKVTAVVAGGATRSDSVKRCLGFVGPDTDIVLIHDGARPFLDDALIDGSIRLARKFGACVTAVPESDTVKESSKELFVKRTIDRGAIYRAQTPQAFKREVIMRSYAICRDAATDDSELAEKAGYRVRILPGSYRNIKITTREDLKMAESLL